MPGMEFASELVVRAALAGYDIVEVPTTLRKDGRSRPPHLRTWRDGWRHLRFLLVFAPNKTLVAPGVVLSVLGLLATVALDLRPISVGSVRFDVSALVYACLLLVVGVQLLMFGGCASIYGQSSGLTRPSANRWLVSVMRLENLVAVGLGVAVFGAAGTVLAVSRWGSVGFTNLQPDQILRVVMPSATLIAIGTICMFSGLLASLLNRTEVLTLTEGLPLAEVGPSDALASTGRVPRPRPGAQSDATRVRTTTNIG